MKFKRCEGLNSSVFLPLAIAFPNLTSLEYSYGAYDIYDSATPIRLLSGLIMTSCNTLKRIILDWHSPDNLDITQLVEIIAQQKLEINMSRRINPYCALSIFANAPLKSLEHSIQLYFDYHDLFTLKFNLLNQIFESIFYK
ncbi:11175_t:CDS:2, partial [Dentiscutata heterogama]